MGFMFMFNRVLYSYIAWAVPHSIRNFSSIILLFFLTLISDGHRRNFRVGKIFLFLCFSLTTVPLKICVFIRVLQFFCDKFLDKFIILVALWLWVVVFGFCRIWVVLLLLTRLWNQKRRTWVPRESWFQIT